MLIEPYDGTPGLIGLVNEDNIDVFGTLLLQDVRDDINNGLPVICLGWMVDEKAAGAVSGTVSEDVFQINSLYVAPGYRKMGGGNFLLESIEGLVSDYVGNIGIRFASTGAEAGLLEVFLNHRGYRSEILEDQMYVTTLADAEVEREFSRDDEIVGESFADTSERLLKKITKQTDVLKQPLPNGGLLGPDVDREISRFYGDEDKYLFVAVEKGQDDSLVLSSVVNHTNNPVKLLNMLRDVLASARYIYPAQTRVYIPVVTNVSKKLVLNLIPGAKPVTRYYTKQL